MPCCGVLRCCVLPCCVPCAVCAVRHSGGQHVHGQRVGRLLQPQPCPRPRLRHPQGEGGGVLGWCWAGGGCWAGPCDRGAHWAGAGAALAVRWAGNGRDQPQVPALTVYISTQVRSGAVVCRPRPTSRGVELREQTRQSVPPHSLIKGRGQLQPPTQRQERLRGRAGGGRVAQQLSHPNCIAYASAEPEPEHGCACLAYGTECHSCQGRRHREVPAGLEEKALPVGQASP